MLVIQLGAQVEAIHDDQRTAMQAAARSSRPEQTLARIEAVLACRRSLIEYTGVAPQLADRVARVGCGTAGCQHPGG